MIEKSPTLLRLSHQLQQIPYLASKNLYRVIGHLLAIDIQKAEQLCEAILQAKQNLVQCARCFVWQERSQPCPYCDSVTRDHATVCVVETWHELIAIEKTGGYKGLYHVLGGALSPLDGIEPDDLKIKELRARINDSVKEIILATNQTPEGEATASYVFTNLKQFPGKITCLARGVPVGSSLEFTDRVTVFKALSERRIF